MMSESLLLTAVFETLNKSGLDYCVQNKYEMMPEEIPSDIDMMYRNASEKELDGIVKEILKETGLILTQKIVQDYGEYTYILSYPIPRERFQLQLDFYRVISKGKIRNVLLEKDLLDNKRFYKLFYVPAYYDELRYIIVRRTLKKDMTEAHIAKMQELCDADSLYKIEQDFGNVVAKHVSEMIATGDKTFFYDNYQSFLYAILQMSKKNYKVKERFKFYMFKLINYPFKRIFRTCGMTVAFLAPDGTGKSTVIEGINKTCSGSFYGIENYYFRPRVLKNIGHYNKLNPTEEAKTNNQPHEVQLNGKVKSIIRFMFYNIDFLIGMNTKVYKEKMKKKLIVFDRYYYDYYADMTRYQYNLSSKVARIFRFLIPVPDIVIILDADSSVIRNRKQELTVEEIDKQRKAFQQVAKDIKNVVTINTEKSIDEVISNVTEEVLKCQEKRTRRIVK